ncbi:hypothetical protein CR513_16388, partial [Mucuna pruriens]
MVVSERVDQEPPPVISFNEKDMRYGLPRHNEPMVEIRGGIKLETTFGECNYARTIPVLYTVVDVEALYNLIIGRLVLNKLGAVVSTYHLCMKYPVEKEVRRVWADHQVARHYYEDSLRIGS